jgi:hypothetical protein
MVPTKNSMDANESAVLAKSLDHADTRMVERHYGHLAPSYVADAIRAGAPRFGSLTSNVVNMASTRGP